MFLGIIFVTFKRDWELIEIDYIDVKILKHKKRGRNSVIATYRPHPPSFSLRSYYKPVSPLVQCRYKTVDHARSQTSVLSHYEWTSHS